MSDTHCASDHEHAAMEQAAQGAGSTDKQEGAASKRAQEEQCMRASVEHQDARARRRCSQPVSQCAPGSIAPPALEPRQYGRETVSHRLGHDRMVREVIFIRQIWACEKSIVTSQHDLRKGLPSTHLLVSASSGLGQC